MGIRTPLGENINITLSRELEGKWALYNESDYLLIENVTDTALEVSYKGAKSVRLSVTDAFVRSDGGLYLTLEGHSDGLVELTMTLPKDTYLSPITGRYQDLGFTISITDGLHITSSFVNNSSSKTNY